MSKKKYKSYDLLYENNQNYLDILSLNLVNFLSEMKDINIKYDQIIQLANDHEKQLIIFGFNYLKLNLFPIKFFSLMRDYSNILFELLKKEGTEEILVEKYSEVQKYINSTRFISVFMGKEAYNALSLTLHNLNIFEFGKEKYDKSFFEYKKFNDAFVKNNINDIKKEFEEIISLFKYCHNNEKGSISFQIDKNYSVYQIFNFLLNKSKKI